MALPQQSQKSVTLSRRKVAEIQQNLTHLRHDVNNHLTLIVAAAEIARRRPQQPDAFWESLMQKPMKAAAQVTEFSEYLERTLGIGRE